MFTTKQIPTMRPDYQFPRSHGSLDLTDPTTVSAQPPVRGPSGSRSHPSLIVTDPSGQAPRSLSDEQYLEKYTSVVNILREGSQPDSARHPSVGLAARNPAHLSTPAIGRSKSLSCFSEYSESMYSSGTRARDSREPPSSPRRSEASRSPSPGESTTDPAFDAASLSFSFPAPPPVHAAHRLTPQGRSLIPVTTPTSPQPVPSQRFHITNPDPASPSLSTSPVPGITRHHLPSRPLTTPIPLANPTLVPVPLDNFAAPPAPDRAESPQWSSHSHGSSASEQREYMVQLPGRTILNESSPGAQPHQRLSRHAPEHSEASTVWATAEDEKFFNGVRGGPGVVSVDVYAGEYESDSFDGSHAGDGAGSPNRFTLDDEKLGVGRDLQQQQQRRKGSDASTTTATQGWEPEPEEPRKGANRRLLWAFLLLVIIGIAVGVGVGVGKKQASGQTTQDGSLASASVPASASKSSSAPVSASSSASTSSLRTAILPSSTSASSATSVETYSTTFAFEQSGRTTVVPLTYTIPSSYITRDDGRYQFTESVVLPNLASTGGSFTSDLRFRVAPTGTASASDAVAAISKRELPDSDEATERARRWDRRQRDKRGRVIR